MLVLPESGELFFTADFTHNVNKEGAVTRPFRNFLDRVFMGLEEDGRFQVFCPVKEAGWETQAVLDTAQDDLEAIERCVGVMALLGKGNAPHIPNELSWGIACRKAIVVAFSNKINIEATHQQIAQMPITFRVQEDNPIEMAARTLRFMQN